MVATTAVAAKVGMLIKRPASDVFEAFVNPGITTKFWFTKSTGRLDGNKQVRWDWEMYGVHSDVEVEALEPNRRIAIKWSGYGTPNRVEWRFTDRADGTTYVEIENTGFSDAEGDVAAQAVSSTEGLAYTLAGAKAWLEHGLRLDLVPDKFPDQRPE
jgi:uncharacterized protein YndB with AHSA1/START domain